MKDARLSLLLTEVMKIARLKSSILDAPRQSSPRPRLRHGKRLAADKLTRRGALLLASTVSCSLSLSLTSRIHSSLFSDWRRAVSSKFFDPKVPSVYSEEPMLPCNARCLISRLFCNGHNLLLNCFLCKIGRIENPSCSICGLTQNTSHVLHSPATDSLHRSHLATLCSSTTSGPSPVEFFGLWGSMAFRHAPSLGRDRITTTVSTRTQTSRLRIHALLARQKN